MEIQTPLAHNDLEAFWHHVNRWQGYRSGLGQSRHPGFAALRAAKFFVPDIRHRGILHVIVEISRIRLPRLAHHPALSADSCRLGVKRRAVPSDLTGIVVNSYPETFMGLTARLGL
jgi:hypothetical protein